MIFLSFIVFVVGIVLLCKAIAAHIALRRCRRLSCELENNKQIIDNMDSAYEHCDFKQKESIDNQFPDSIANVKKLIEKVNDKKVKDAFPLDALVTCKKDWQKVSSAIEQKSELFGLNTSDDDKELREMIRLQRDDDARKIAQNNGLYVENSGYKQSRLNDLYESTARRVDHTIAEVKMGVSAIIEANDALDRYSKDVFPTVKTQFQCMNKELQKLIISRGVRRLCLIVGCSVCLIGPIILWNIPSKAKTPDSTVHEEIVIPEQAPAAGKSGVKSEALGSGESAKVEKKATESNSSKSNSKSDKKKSSSKNTAKANNAREDAMKKASSDIDAIDF